MSAPVRGLRVVWRNSEPVRSSQRWERLKHGADSSLYLVQQFISLGDFGFWSTTSALQMLSGGVTSVSPIKDRLKIR